MAEFKRGACGNAHGGRDLPALAQIAGVLKACPFGSHTTFAFFAGKIFRAQGSGPGPTEVGESAEIGQEIRIWGGVHLSYIKKAWGKMERAADKMSVL
jgi:hypothetical protein